VPDASSPVPPGARRYPQPTGGYSFWVIGAERTLLRDAYHTFLTLRWSASLAYIALGYFFVNLVFAAVYLIVGGVAGLNENSFFDALVFSVQTLGTIGYGVMHPQSHAANIVMIVESIVGIIVTALVTGLVFSKFSRASGRMAFTTNCVITKHDGRPTLMFRCGNRRSNVIVEAQIRVLASFTHVTAEGHTFYKGHDLKLVRDHMTGMRRGWTVMHVIDETSPFHGLDSAALAKAEVEMEIALIGMDDVTMQTVHAMHHYSNKQIVFGHRFADTLSPLPNGDMLLDLTKFDVLVPEVDARDSVPA
jgi:inward rectifier potassium channel